ncbi:MAG TPA: peptidylprolyl isomerase [Acidimicrobiales bacterium]|nr:peptidylprolyl isomerase [Acidimicrobiales bacterium]
MTYLAEAAKDLYDRAMRRVLPLLALALVAGGAAACDASFTPYAAKVNGSTISEKSIESDLRAIENNAPLKCIVSANNPIIGAGGSGTFSSAFAASRLTSSVVSRLVESDLARRHIAVTQVATGAAQNELSSLFQGQSTCTQNPSAAVQAFSPALRSSLVDPQAATDALSAQLAGEPLTVVGVANFARAHPITTSDQCVSVIFATSQSRAAALGAAIAQGASFATVAKASSVESTSAANGGAIGCVVANSLPSPINTMVTTLKIGEVSAPVAYSSNGVTYYLLVEVTSRKPSLTTAAEVLIGQGSAAESALVSRQLSQAKVEVNPSYGTWSNASGSFQVTPQHGPPAKFLGNVAAITPKVAP